MLVPIDRRRWHAKLTIEGERARAGARSSAILAVLLIAVGAAGAAASRRLRPLVRQSAGERERLHLHGRGHAVVGRRVASCSNGVLNYHNAGKVQASSEPQDMRLQRMLGHLTTLMPASRKQHVLVIGCGAGVTAGAVSISPALERETIAEIEPLVPKVVSKYFGAHNYNVVTNPKVHVQIDDARHFILTTQREVRRGHVRSARPVGEGRGDAVHARSSSRS